MDTANWGRGRGKEEPFYKKKHESPLLTKRIYILKHELKAFKSTKKTKDKPSNKK